LGGVLGGFTHGVVAVALEDLQAAAHTSLSKIMVVQKSRRGLSHDGVDGLQGLWVDASPQVHLGTPHALTLSQVSDTSGF
jgi:hypothetical protein